MAVIASAAEGDLRNGAFQSLFDGTAITATDGSPTDPADHPVARARRGEPYTMDLLIRRGRRRLGRFEVRSSPASGTPGGLNVDARKVD